MCYRSMGRSTKICRGRIMKGAELESGASFHRGSRGNGCWSGRVCGNGFFGGGWRC